MVKIPHFLESCFKYIFFIVLEYQSCLKIKSCVAFDPRCIRCNSCIARGVITAASTRRAERDNTNLQIVVITFYHKWAAWVTLAYVSIWSYSTKDTWLHNVRSKGLGTLRVRDDVKINILQSWSNVATCKIFKVSLSTLMPENHAFGTITYSRLLRILRQLHPYR